MFSPNPFKNFENDIMAHAMKRVASEKLSDDNVKTITKYRTSYQTAASVEAKTDILKKVLSETKITPTDNNVREIRQILRG